MYLRKMTGEYYTIHELKKIMSEAEKKRRVSAGFTDQNSSNTVSSAMPTLYHNYENGGNNND